MGRGDQVKIDIALAFKVTGYKMTLYQLADKPN